MSDAKELFPEQRGQLSEEWHETFDTLTAQGKAPSAILATIEYVTTGKTQDEAGDEYNVSDMTIRNLKAAVVALGPIDSAHGTSRDGSSMTIMDYCNHLADRLGWEEGDEYSVSQAYSGASKQVSLKKSGWKSLHQEYINTEEKNA